MVAIGYDACVMNFALNLFLTTKTALYALVLIVQFSAMFSYAVRMIA